MMDVGVTWTPLGDFGAEINFSVELVDETKRKAFFPYFHTLAFSA